MRITLSLKVRRGSSYRCLKSVSRNNLRQVVCMCACVCVLLGACGGELACATCHLIFEKEIYDTLPAKEDEEDDMLDLAFELTET